MPEKKKAGKRRCCFFHPKRLDHPVPRLVVQHDRERRARARVWGCGEPMREWGGVGGASERRDRERRGLAMRPTDLCAPRPRRPSQSRARRGLAGWRSGVGRPVPCVCARPHLFLWRQGAGARNSRVRPRESGRAVRASFFFFLLPHHRNFPDNGASHPARRPRPHLGPPGHPGLHRPGHRPGWRRPARRRHVRGRPGPGRRPACCVCGRPPDGRRSGRRGCGPVAPGGDRSGAGRAAGAGGGGGRAGEGGRERERKKTGQRMAATRAPRLSTPPLSRLFSFTRSPRPPWPRPCSWPALWTSPGPAPS